MATLEPIHTHLAQSADFEDARAWRNGGHR